MFYWISKFSIIIILVSSVSCVSSSRYKAVEYTMINTEQKLRSAQETIGSLQADTLLLGTKSRVLSNEVAALKGYSSYSKSTLSNKISKLEQKLNDQENVISGQDRYLIKQTEELRKKETALVAQKRELDNIKILLRSRNLMADTILARTLRSFPTYAPQELNIYKRNGKVYLSIGEAMLFKKDDVKVIPNTSILRRLSGLVTENLDLKILIEVHSDDKKPRGMKDNWAFTNQRAIAITRDLTDNGVQPYRISPIGKSEYFPIYNNSVEEERQRNRRIVVILSPDLKQLNQLLDRL